MVRGASEQVKKEGEISPSLGLISGGSVRKQRSALKLWIRWLFFLDALTVVATLLAISTDFTAIPSQGVLIGGAASVLLLFYLHDLYNPVVLSGGTSEYPRVFRSLNVLLVVILLAGYAFNFLKGSIGGIVNAYLILLVAFGLERFVTRRVFFMLRRYPSFRQRAVIVGVTDEGRFMARQIGEVRSPSLDIVGFLDQTLGTGEAVEGRPILGKYDDLKVVIQAYGIDCVLVSDSSFVRSRLEADEQFLDTLKDVEVQLVTGAPELLHTTVRVREEAFMPVVVLDKKRGAGIHFAAKMVLDLVGASLALLILSPILLVLSVLIAIGSRGPIVYRRRVVGQGGKPFDAFKFRTMYVDGDARLSPEEKEELERYGKLKNDPRITPVGKILRKFSLDELPQLVNVLRLEMSLVGPRMITSAELDKFGVYRHSRMMMRPGLTGLWQVSGRSDVSYEDRVKLDTLYVRNYTIWLDVDIIFRTIPVLLFGRGAY